MKTYRITLLTLAAAATQAVGALDIDPRGCVEMALERSEQVKEARIASEQARLQQGVARTAYLPDFSGSATVGWSLPDYDMKDMGMHLRMRGLYMAGVSVTQPIFAGGKIVAANRMAGIGRKAAGEQLRLTRLQVAAAAETSYWSYVAVLAKRDMMNSYMAQIDTAVAQTRAAIDAGMAVESDLLRVEARRAQVAYQQEQVELGADLCRMALCNALVLPDTTSLTPAHTEIPEELPAGMGDYDIDSRPEVKLLEADVEVKRQQVRSTRADYLPTLGAQAGWNAYGNARISGFQQGPDGNMYPFSQKVNSNGWAIMVSLQVPLFHWGEGYKKVKHARLEVENSRLELERNRRLLNLEVKQAITNVTSGRMLVESARKALEQASVSLESVNVRYHAGMCTLTDLLDAQSQWHTSRANLIEAATQLRVNIVEYKRATATLL